MELACDIVRKKAVMHNIETSLNKIKELNIGSIASKNFNAFMKFITLTGLTEQVNDLLNSLIDSNEDISQSILIAYFISSHTKDQLSSTFGHYKDNAYTKKVIYAANELVSYIERSNKRKSITGDFFDCLDHYYSLYRMWIPNYTIETIDTLFSKVEDKIKIYLISIQKGIINGIDVEISNIVKEMFNIDFKVATKKVLSSYKLISVIPTIKNEIWKILRDKSKEYKEHIFLILVAELRIILIRRLTESNDKRDIYYNVDTENILRAIRDGTLSVSDVSYYLVLLSEKVNRLDIQDKTDIVNKIKTFRVWDDEFNKFIINCFHMMFDLVSQ